MKSRLQVLCFLVGGRIFAIDIMGIREILRNQRFTPVPHTPDNVAGVLNLRGEMIPVVDVHGVLLGRPNPVAGENLKLVVAHARGKTTGLLVDQLLDVVTVPPESLSPVPGGYDDADATRSEPIVLATFRRGDLGDGEIVVLLRLALLADEALATVSTEGAPC